MIAPCRKARVIDFWAVDPWCIRNRHTFRPGSVASFCNNNNRNHLLYLLFNPSLPVLHSLWSGSVFLLLAAEEIFLLRLKLGRLVLLVASSVLVVIVTSILVATTVATSPTSTTHRAAASGMCHRAGRSTAAAARRIPARSVHACQRTRLIPRLSLGQRTNPIAVQGSRSRTVLPLDRHRLVPVVLRVQKLSRLPIAAHLHLLQLDVLPLVHRHGPHEGQMHTETAVLARALETDPDAVRHRDPLGVVGATFEAFLQRGEKGRRGEGG